MTLPIVRIATRRKGWSSASGSDIFDCEEVAQAAWGPRAHDRNSGLTAFAYLWRRFGPSPSGCDGYKDLVSYTLTTPDPDVHLWLHLSGSALYLALGYSCAPSIRKAIDDVSHKWEAAWHEEYCQRVIPDLDDAGFEALPEEEKTAHRTAYYHARYCTTDEGKALFEQIVEKIGRRSREPIDAAKARVQGACILACKDLLRPVGIRDVSINIFGRCDWPKGTPKSVGRGVKQYHLSGYGIDTREHERKWKK